jgi:hypothetical protein
MISLELPLTEIPAISRLLHSGNMEMRDARPTCDLPSQWPLLGCVAKALFSDQYQNLRFDGEVPDRRGSVHQGVASGWGDR